MASCCWQPVQYNRHDARSATDFHACARFAICRCCFPEVRSASRSDPLIAGELPEARILRAFRPCVGCSANWSGPPSAIEPCALLLTGLPGPEIHTVAPSQQVLCLSTSIASARNRQRGIRPKAIGPCLHGLVVDDATHVDISQSLTREAATFFFLVNPG